MPPAAGPASSVLDLFTRQALDRVDRLLNLRSRLIPVLIQALNDTIPGKRHRSLVALADLSQIGSGLRCRDIGNFPGHLVQR